MTRLSLSAPRPPFLSRCLRHGWVVLPQPCPLLARVPPAAQPFRVKVHYCQEYFPHNLGNYLTLLRLLLVARPPPWPALPRAASAAGDFARSPTSTSSPHPPARPHRSRALVKHLGGDSARSYGVLRDYRRLCIAKKVIGDLNNMIPLALQRLKRQDVNSYYDLPYARLSRLFGKTLSNLTRPVLLRCDIILINQIAC